MDSSPLSMFDIPFVRTLSMQSNATGVMAVETVQTNENGTEISSIEVVQVPREKVVKYIPKGNHKWLVLLSPLL